MSGQRYKHYVLLFTIFTNPVLITQFHSAKKKMEFHVLQYSSLQSIEMPISLPFSINKDSINVNFSTHIQTIFSYL